jgi:hypothetical protein
VITQTYCGKVDSIADNGCKREWNYLKEMLEKGNIKKHRVIFGYCGDYEKSVQGSVKAYLKDKLLLNLDTDIASLALRVFRTM